MSTSAQLQAWLNGTPTGGPNSDGRYPLIYADGQTYLVYCPAAQALNPALTEQPIEVFANTATAAANTATAEAAEATTASVAAQTSAANALGSQNAAAASATTASTQATAAGTSATNAAASATAANNSATAASGSATTASTANTNAGLARDKAQKWADENVDTTVEPAKYSARHWAQKAADSVAGGHVHTIADVTGLQTALDAKLASASFTWTGLTGKPATFAPSAHTHVIADVTGLQTALDGKQAVLGYTPANIAGANFTGQVQGTSGVRVTGSTTFGAGEGIEVYYSAGRGYVIAYDRTGLVWKDLRLYGLTQEFYTAGALRLTIDSAGVSTFGSNVLARDITASRGDGTGVIFLNAAASRYLLFDGTNYTMPGAQLYVNNNLVWNGGNFDPATKQNALGYTPMVRDTQIVTDWNTPLVNGMYMASGAANNPTGTAAWYIGRVTVHNSDWITQEVWDFTSTFAGQEVWRRQKNSGTWSGWTRNQRIAGVTFEENSGVYVNGTFRLRGTDDAQLAANSASWVRIPRTFVQSGDPGAAAADGDLWAW